MYIRNIIIIIGIIIVLQEKQQNLIEREVMDLVYYLAFLPPPHTLLFTTLLSHLVTKTVLEFFPVTPLMFCLPRGGRGGLGAK